MWSLEVRKQMLAANDWRETLGGGAAGGKKRSKKEEEKRGVRSYWCLGIEKHEPVQAKKLR